MPARATDPRRAERGEGEGEGEGGPEPERGRGREGEDVVATDFLSALLVIGGGFFLVVGALGLVRLPDLFTRLHAAGVGDTLGVGLFVLGFMLLADFGSVTVKLALVLVFLLLTGPVATHALAKAALHGGLRPAAARSPGAGAKPAVDPPWNT